MEDRYVLSTEDARKQFLVYVHDEMTHARMTRKQYLSAVDQLKKLPPLRVLLLAMRKNIYIPKPEAD